MILTPLRRTWRGQTVTLEGSANCKLVMGNWQRQDGRGWLTVRIGRTGPARRRRPSRTWCPPARRTPRRPLPTCRWTASATARRRRSTPSISCKLTSEKPASQSKGCRQLTKTRHCRLHAAAVLHLSLHAWNVRIKFSGLGNDGK